jgi:hypothetical protein
MTLGWIICLNYGCDSRELWWDAAGGTSATIFPSQAVRFARLDDAETVMTFLRRTTRYDCLQAVKYVE